MSLVFSNPRRAWVALTVVLLGLALGAVLLVQQHTTDELQDTREATRRELRLLAQLLEADLQAGNYQDLDNKLAGWGARDPSLVMLTVTAANGFVLGQYQRATPADDTLTDQTSLRYSYQGEATLVLARDLTDIHMQRGRLMAQLMVVYTVVGVLLVFLLRTLTARLREAVALRLLTNELNDSNAVLHNEISERQRTEEALFDAKERAEVTLHSIGDAVITTDASGRIEYLNPVAEKLTGWPDGEARGRPLGEVFRVFNEDTREPVATPAEQVLREGCVVGLANHTMLIARDGREMGIEDSAAPIHSRAGEIIGVVLVFHDVTESREMANQLSWQATHDALTGLVNRREFESRLLHAITLARSDNKEHALLYLDLDQFKLVNDTCGHMAGDELLRQLSQHLQQHLRASDTLARLGGDEFGVLLENCPLDRALRIADSLREEVAGFHFTWIERRFDIGVSIGLVPVHAESGSLDSLLATADMACYAAKEAGRNRVHLYRESDQDLKQRHGEMLWVSRITAAIEQNRFVLYRQAIAGLENGNDRHYELLLRLRGDNGEIIPPGAFLPAAERYNLMPQIDRWVIGQALAMVAEGRCGHDDQCLVAINLSGASLGDARFMDFVQFEMQRHSSLTRRLCFEITETAAIADLTRAAAFIQDMRALGCRFALDDFGAGLSSFGYLKNLPVDFLKIDGNLVRGIADNRTDLAMVQAINDIGHSLGIRTVAEWVENDAIRARLAELRVDYGQGFGIAKPEPIPD